MINQKSKPTCMYCYNDLLKMNDTNKFIKEMTQNIDKVKKDLKLKLLEIEDDDDEFNYVII